MRHPLLALALVAGLGACHREPQPPGAQVESAVVTLPAVPGRPGAAYFMITTNQAAHLTGISSPKVGRIELHESMSHQGMSTMRPLASVAIGPATPLAFAPGGKHAMLYDISPDVAAGSRIRLNFAFDTLPAVSVDAEVRSAGAGHAND
jgi:copper(I)-binding protein